jgi:hypothetical protein
MGITAVCGASEAGGVPTNDCYNGSVYAGAANTDGWSAIACNGGICDANTIPITLAQAQNLCTRGVNNYMGPSEVAWEFKVRD